MSITGAGASQADYIKQLLFLEAEPLRALQSRRSDLDVRLGIFRDLRIKVDAFKSLIRDLSDAGSRSALKSYLVTASDESAVTGTADENAAVGTHRMEVTSLARAHTVASSGFVGTGTDVTSGSYSFDITVGTTTTSVDVEVAAGDDNGTVMAKVVDALRNTGVEVNTSVITSNTSTDTRQIVLTSQESGTANLIASISDTGGNLMQTLGLAGTEAGGTLNTTIAASDAQFTLDGIAIVSSTNEVSGVLDGVVLSLRSETTGEVEIGIEHDREGIKETMTQTIDAYNEIIDYLNSKLGSGDETGSGRGALAGELTFSTFRNELIRSISIGVHGDFAIDGINSIDDVGLALNREGQLSLSDEDAFFSALTSSPDGIEAYFGSEGGIATRLDDLVTLFTKVGGGLDLSKDLVDSRQDVLDVRIERMEKHLERREEYLIDQLARLSRFAAQIGMQQSGVATVLSGGIFGQGSF